MFIHIGRKNVIDIIRKNSESKVKKKIEKMHTFLNEYRKIQNLNGK